MVDWDKDSSGGDSGIVSMSSNLVRSFAFQDLSFNTELKNVGGIVGGGPGIRGAPMTPSLPPKNGPLSSSIGSIATTIVDQVSDDPEECGKVAGWVASFDKLLADPLGVHTLTVSLGTHKQSQEGREGGRELLLLCAIVSVECCLRVRMCVCVYVCLCICVVTTWVCRKASENLMCGKIEFLLLGVLTGHQCCLHVFLAVCGGWVGSGGQGGCAGWSQVCSHAGWSQVCSCGVESDLLMRGGVRFTLVCSTHWPVRIFGTR